MIPLRSSEIFKCFQIGKRAQNWSKYIQNISVITTCLIKTNETILSSQNDILFEKV